MRFCHVTTYPPDLLQTHDEATPELAQASHAIQHQRRMALLYGWSDFIVRRVQARGGSGTVIVANDDRVQRQWAREHGVPNGRDTILLEQLKHERPDVLFLEDCYNIPVAVLREAKRSMPSPSLVVGYSGYVSSGAKFPKTLGELDAVVTSAPSLADAFKAKGVDAIVVRHGFESRVLDEVPDGGAPIAASFIGSLAATLHRERRELLETVSRIVPLAVYSDSLRPRPKAALRQFAAAAARRQLGAHFALLASPLRRQAQRSVYGADMYAVLRRSGMSFNQHGGNVSFFVPNMRLFEVTGCGSCLVTDSRPGLEALFEPDHEVVTYRSVDECAEKVAWLVEHPEQRASIAAAGQRRTLRDHTFSGRMDELLDALDTRL